MAFAGKLFALYALLLVVVVASASVKESRTGISFPDKFKGSHLSKLGVRTKGPIKVYAVGQYDKTFLLKMSYGVGAEKMASALVDALKPRCGDKKKIEDFKDVLLKGLPNGARKGTQMAFGTGGGKLTVNVNDKNVGSISSKPLANAFQGIYTDRKAVCEMKPVDEDEEGGGSSGGHAFITPKRGAAVGATLGYGIGKLLS